MKTKLTVLLITLMMMVTTIPVSAVGAIVTVTPTDDQNRGDTITITLDNFAAGFVSVQITTSGGTPVWAYQYTSTGAQKVIDLVIPSSWSKGTYTVYAKPDGLASVSDTFYLYVPSSGGYTPPPSSLPPPVTTPTPDEVEDLTPEDAADTLETLGAEDAADIITEVNTTKAADIMTEVDNVTAAAIVLEAVKADKTEEVAKIINKMDREAAGDLLLAAAPEEAAAVIEKMGESDLTEAAWRVEEAVKRSGNAERLKEFGGTLQKVSVTELVRLFREIAGLPATPSTVAEVFEVMDIEKVIDVVDAWMTTESYEDLSLVYSFLTDEKLEEVYLAMTTDQRNTIYPYLDEATASRVPDLGEFEVSDLSIIPDTADTGDVFTISVKVSNVGNETGAFTVNLKIDGSTEETDTVTLAPEMDETVSWTVSKATAGTYNVEVNGLTGSFEVTEPPVPVEPAEFQYGSLTLIPEDPEEGTDVSASINVENVGGEAGSELVELEVDGSVVDSETISLGAGESEVIEFTLTASGEGSHNVKIGDKTATYTVMAVPEPEGVSPIVYGIALVVIAAAAYFYMQSQKEA